MMVLIGGLNFGNAFLFSSVDSLEPILAKFYGLDSENLATLNYAVIIPKVFGIGLLEKYFLRRYEFVLPILLVALAICGQFLVAFGLGEYFFNIALVGKNYFP